MQPPAPRRALRRARFALWIGWGHNARGTTAVIMRAPAPFILALLVALAATPARAFPDAQLIDAFERTVFGSEYPSWGWQAFMVKKFAGPVRFHIDDRSAAGRGGEAAAF